MPKTFRLSGNDWRILGLLPTEWAWRKIGQADTDLDNLTPAASAWLPAQVPGDVQSDLRDADEIPDPWFERNSRACEWTSDRDWIYRKEFTAPPEMRDMRRIRLRFGGVDFSCHVFLNGKHLGNHVGMYDPFAFDVTDVLNWDAPNRLIVVIDHAPKEPEVQGQIGYTNRIRLWKARFAYDWDWCTRLIPLGIWQDVTLEADDGISITDVWVRSALNATLDEATITVHTSWDAPVRGRLLAELRYRGEDAPFLHDEAYLEEPTTEQTLTLTVTNPMLWYPNGSGRKLDGLYEARVSLRSEMGATLEESAVRFGIRDVQFVPNDNAPDDALPYVLEVNGVRTFIKGWNWVPVDQLYGRPHAEKYRHLLRLAQEANCNLLRVWGGGLLERDLFYDLCDEAGIFVWQEFIQSSSGIDNEASTDPDYIAYCREQAEKMIVQRRNHPSLLLWCGGNELMTPDWKPLSNAHPNMAALKETVARLDPDRPFLPTSPSGPLFGADPDKPGQMHDVHGNW
ncbi:MAG TPA: glycoside hydrolase family 2 TIM barrel-domain containing protein, partial [Chthonomonadaceae bacterium]|nr:glycoside hydrolase family 2 TIM barrel-domain containing protein [Chthonomonadaceae bacterium]